MMPFDLPPLRPDIVFRRLGDGPDDRDLAFEFKRAALGPHIVSRWGWDEGLQRDLHRRRFAEKPFHAIRPGTEDIGTLSVQPLADHVRFGEFYIRPDQQGRGTGTRVLRHCLALADALGLPVRLEYLEWNPVGGLYRRHGFAEVGRSDIHVFLERPVGAG